MVLSIKKAKQHIRYELYVHLIDAIMWCRKYRKTKSVIALFPPGVDIENLENQLEEYYDRAVEEVNIAVGLGLGFMHMYESQGLVVNDKFTVQAITNMANRICTIRTIVYKVCYE